MVRAGGGRSANDSSKLHGKLGISLLVASLVAVLAACVHVFYQYEGHLRAMLEANPILQAFLAPSLTGVVLYWVNQLSSTVIDRFRSLCYSSIFIESSDENYATVLDFICDKCVADESASLLATTKKKNGIWRQEWRDETSGMRKKTPTFAFRPAKSSEWHIFEYKGRRFMALRMKGEVSKDMQRRLRVVIDVFEGFVTSVWFIRAVISSD
jgi:hypothetical protein